MDFVSNRPPQVKAMLEYLGISSIEELYAAVPKNLMLSAPSADDGFSEAEGIELMRELGKLNTFDAYDCYLGAGSYDHYIPALVSAITSKSEFLTSYTPYQAEASQGMLQIIFEFQSSITALTGLDAANASLYDGASAAAEAVLMALRLTKRNEVVISCGVHPHYRSVVMQYLAAHQIKVHLIPVLENGLDDVKEIENVISDQTAGLLLQSPNFFGAVQDFSKLFQKSSEKGGIGIISANPLAYGLFLSAKEMGAEIAVGDTQPFGLPLQFGGPSAGYIACKGCHIRQMPGRIVGETLDNSGKRGYVLTLQAREQHIRREKATSNICSNQALAALASLISILWYGKNGVKQLALDNYRRAEYLKERLSKIPGLLIERNVPTFNEFVVKFDRPIVDVLAHFRKLNIEPGVQLASYGPSFKQALLVTVTETKSKAKLDSYIRRAEEL